MSPSPLRQRFPNYPFWKDARDIAACFEPTDRGWRLSSALTKGVTIEVWRDDNPLPYAIGYSSRAVARASQELFAKIYAIQLAIDGELMSEDSYG